MKYYHSTLTNKIANIRVRGLMPKGRFVYLCSSAKDTYKAVQYEQENNRVILEVELDKELPKNKDGSYIFEGIIPPNLISRVQIPSHSIKTHQNRNLGGLSND